MDLVVDVLLMHCLYCLYIVGLVTCFCKLCVEFGLLILFGCFGIGFVA